MTVVFTSRTNIRLPPCVKLARAIKTTGISMFVRAAAGLRDSAALRLCRDAAAGVIFSGQNFCRAQSKNCETKTPNTCATHKTGGPNILGNTMPNLTIGQLVAKINKRASTHAIGELQQIRKQLKRRGGSSCRTIFSHQTTFEYYAFHHGGRSELQFNIGVDDDDEEYVRHGVAFSLETGRNLPSIEVLVPKIRLFNEFLQANIELLSNFEMWHFQNDQRSSNRSPTAIMADIIQPGVFIFLGALQPISRVDYDKILADFDLLLPLFKFVESNGAVSPYKDSPGAFAFRAGNRAKKSSTTASQTARQLSVELRHNELQAALYSELCAEHGAENVGTEQPSGSGGRIDSVVKTKNGYMFFEIKVGQSLQACLREAIGQLLEYSYWPSSKCATSLVVVGEPPLDSECRAYIERIRRDLSVPISYRRIQIVES